MDIQAAVTQGIRTAAQAVAGLIILFFLEYGIEIDSGALTAVLVGLFSGLYAVITTLLARYVHPVFGLLSIIPKTPVYEGAIETTGRPR